MHSTSIDSKKRGCDAKGFTLVEAIVAVVVFSMVMLGVYACMIKAYQFSQLTRYNDQARSILLSYIDQFERLETVGNNGYVRPLFTPALTTGVGLNWPAMSNSNTASGQDSFIPVTLGDGTSTSTITAKVSRAVYGMNPNTGALVSITTDQKLYSEAPGYMLMGVFTISYTIKSSGKEYSQRLFAVRTVP